MSDFQENAFHYIAMTSVIFLFSAALFNLPGIIGSAFIMTLFASLYGLDQLIRTIQGNKPAQNPSMPTEEPASLHTDDINNTNNIPAFEKRINVIRKRNRSANFLLNLSFSLSAPAIATTLISGLGLSFALLNPLPFFVSAGTLLVSAVPYIFGGILKRQVKREFNELNTELLLSKKLAEQESEMQKDHFTTIQRTLGANNKTVEADINSLEKISESKHQSETAFFQRAKVASQKQEEKPLTERLNMSL